MNDHDQERQRQITEVRNLVARMPDVRDLLKLLELVGDGGTASSIMAAVLRAELTERKAALELAQRLAEAADIVQLNAQLAAVTGQAGRSRELTMQASGLVGQARQARARAIPDDEAAA